MTPEQVQLVRRSFARLQPQAELVAKLFYSHLFQIDPGLQPLFRSDMEPQGRRLMQMLAAAVALLDHPDKLLPVLRDLGERHAGYGVQPEQYATVGEALIDTLGVSLGAQRFDAATREAWTTAYALVTETMLEAAVALA